MKQFIHKIKLLTATGVFLTTPFLLLAQVNQITGNELNMDSPLPGENSYVLTARDQILLQPGFSYNSAQGGSLFSQIDPWFMEPVDINNITGGPGGDIGQLVGTEGVVGAIPGAFAASPSGAATYTIPIECPQGMNGMTPNVSLTYNSQAGNGIAGWGWNIGGLSAVSRVQKNVYYDGEAKSINWDNTDVFALDGHRLLVKMNYGDSIEYWFENDPKPKIMAYDFNRFGPGWFKLWDGKGNILTYSSINALKYRHFNFSNTVICSGQPPIYSGATNDTSISISAYYITRKEDIYKNFIEFSYKVDSITQIIDNSYDITYEDCEEIQYSVEMIREYTNFRINSINYGNHLESLYTVQFGYNLRNDTICGYSNGQKYSNNQILDDISVKYGSGTGNELKKYSLNYNNLEYSYLQSVELSGMEGESFNKTVFEWEDSNYNIEKSDYIYFPLPGYHSDLFNQGYSKVSEEYYNADLNGDGISDFFVTHTYEKQQFPNTYWKYKCAVYINPGNSMTPELKGEGDFMSLDRNFYFIDTDLDGKDEIYFTDYHFESPNWSVRYKRYEYFEDSDSVIHNSEKDIYIPVINADQLHLVPADFDGNGFPNHLLLRFVENRYYFENSSNFLDQCSYSDFGGPRKYQLLDFNGNGKTDILFLYDSMIKIWEYNKTSGKFTVIYSSSLFNRNDNIFVCDFNGDGYSDILYQKSDTKDWKIVISDGKKFLSNIIVPPDLYENSGSKTVSRICVYDINQDGKSDILEIKPNGSNYLIQAFIVNNNSFQVVANFNSPEDFRFRNTSELNLNNTLEVFASSYSYFYPPFNYFSISSGINFNTIKKIISGTGIESEVKYGKHANLYNIHSVKEMDDYNSVYSARNFLRTVKEIKSGESLTKYLFYNPIIHTHGKGFLGFGQTITESFDGEQKIGSSLQVSRLIEKGTASKYELLPDTLIQMGNDTVSLTTMSYTTKNINNQHYLVTDSVINNDLVHNTRNVQWFKNYNDYLIPVNTYTRYYQGQDELVAVDSSSVQYMNILYGSTRIIGLPLEVTNYKKRPGEEDYIRKTDFEYYDNGMLKTKSGEKNTAKELKSEFNYDAFGNTLTVTTSAPGETGAPLREQSFIYHPNGYHLQSKENSLGQVESYTYYLENGLLKTITDEANNLTTTMEYDGFGRQQKVRYPDGNEVYSGLRWASGHPHAPENALYYAYQQASGGEPSLEFFDKHNKTLRSMGISFDGTPVYSDTQYDTRQRLYRQSQPYSPQEETKWTTFEHDDFNRLERKDFPDEKFVTFNYGPRVTTTTSEKGSKTQNSKQTVNCLGEVISSEDNDGNIVETKYYASGLPKEKRISGKPFAITLSYDIYGNRDTLSDPDAGVITSTYNAFGELLSQKDANGNKTGYKYDDLGRILEEKQFAPGDILLNTKSFIYDTRFAGALSTVEQDNPDHGAEYYYDSDGFGRLVKTVEIYDNQTIENKFSHDAYGRLKTHEYPSGLKVNHQYNVYGYLKNISAANKTLWECHGMNSLGQITSHKQGSYISQTGYNPYGDLQSQTFANGRGMAYGFDDMGNMEFRQDTYRNLKENFKYDNLNRLQTIEYHVNGIHQLYNDRHMEYDDAGGVGNISSITGTGSGFVYGEDAGPHALTSVNIPEPGWRPVPQEINYTAFNKVSSITDTLEGGRILSYEILYGMDNQRRKSVYKDSGQVVRTKHYFGDYEKINENSTVKNYHYISSPTGLCAIFVTDDQGGQGQLWHTYSDHLGSLVYMVNADNSNDYKEYSHDAWGNPRDPDDWTQPATQTLFAGRGFTGHEYLEEFALINMNGRIYDPMLGRFFSPDLYVQLPGYAGSYNRYSYCLNNPLMYTDPSGEIIWMPIIIGAAYGAFQGAMIADQAGAQGFGEWAAYIGGGALIGGLAGGAASGISALGGGAWIAGAGAGAVGGAGFSGMATGWDGNAMITGAVNGAISGAVGGAVGSAFGGAPGAYLGGASSNVTGQLLRNDGDLSQVNWGSAIVSGAISYGTYHTMSFHSYLKSDGKFGAHDVTYRGWNKINSDMQRSMFWKKENGGFIDIHGNVKRVSYSNEFKHHVNFTAADQPTDVATAYHTHWQMPGRTYYQDDGSYVAPEGFSQKDLQTIKATNYVITRKSFYMGANGSVFEWTNGGYFLRFFMFPFNY